MLVTGAAGADAAQELMLCITAAQPIQKRSVLGTCSCLCAHQLCGQPPQEDDASQGSLHLHVIKHKTMSVHQQSDGPSSAPLPWETYLLARQHQQRQQLH